MTNFNLTQDFRWCTTNVWNSSGNLAWCLDLVPSDFYSKLTKLFKTTFHWIILRLYAYCFLNIRKAKTGKKWQNNFEWNLFGRKNSFCSSSPLFFFFFVFVFNPNVWLKWKCSNNWAASMKKIVKKKKRSFRCYFLPPLW